MACGSGAKRQWRGRLTLAGRPGGPGSRDAGPAGEGLAGGGEAPVAAAVATGGRTGGEAQTAHARSVVLNTAQVAARGDAGDGAREVDATQRLERLHDGGETPPLDLRPEVGREALPPVRMFRNGAAVCLEDHLRRRRGTDHVRPPASGPAQGPRPSSAVVAWCDRETARPRRVPRRRQRPAVSRSR